MGVSVGCDGRGGRRCCEGREEWSCEGVETVTKVWRVVVEVIGEDAKNGRMT